MILKKILVLGLGVFSYGVGSMDNLAGDSNDPTKSYSLEETVNHLTSEENTMAKEEPIQAEDKADKADTEKKDKLSEDATLMKKLNYCVLNKTSTLLEKIQQKQALPPEECLWRSTADKYVTFETLAIRREEIYMQYLDLPYEERCSHVYHEGFDNFVKRTLNYTEEERKVYHVDRFYEKYMQKMREKQLIEEGKKLDVHVSKGSLEMLRSDIFYKVASLFEVINFDEDTLDLLDKECTSEAEKLLCQSKKEKLGLKLRKLTETLDNFSEINCYLKAVVNKILPFLPTPTTKN